MEKGSVRTSSILIALEGETRAYRTLDELPEELRLKLLESTSGPDAATILITDRAGSREVLRALQGKPSRLDSLRMLSLAGAARTPEKPKRYAVSWRIWAEVLLIGITGLAIWFLVTLK